MTARHGSLIRAFQKVESDSDTEKLACPINTMVGGQLYYEGKSSKSATGQFYKE